MSTASCSSSSDNVDSMVAIGVQVRQRPSPSWHEANMSGRAQLKGSGNVGTTADAVYGALRRSILDGELPPGHRLRSDALAHDLYVSRAPAREEISKPAAGRLLDAAPSA